MPDAKEGPRWLKNLLRLPRRTAQSLRRRFGRQYALQREADRYVRRELPSERVAQLLWVDGTTSAANCRLLYYLAATAPQGEIVEVGSYKGKSTVWLVEAARRRGMHVTSIDPFIKPGGEEGFRRTAERFAFGPLVTSHKALSHDIGATWSQPISMLWVDGCHEFPAVMQDITDFTPHLVSGAAAVFDDARSDQFPGVVQAIQTLIQDDRFQFAGILRHVAVFRRK
jgi:hypothetical protein